MELHINLLIIYIIYIIYIYILYLYTGYRHNNVYRPLLNTYYRPTYGCACVCARWSRPLKHYRSDGVTLIGFDSFLQITLVVEPLSF